MLSRRSGRRRDEEDGRAESEVRVVSFVNGWLSVLHHDVWVFLLLVLFVYCSLSLLALWAHLVKILLNYRCWDVYCQLADRP